MKNYIGVMAFSILLIVGVKPILASSTKTETAAIHSYIEQIRPEFERHLKEIVDIPSVSMDPTNHADIQRMAMTAVKLLQSIGAKAEVVETRGNPVVYGEIFVNQKYPTVLLYNHLDVQPADASEWNTPPFSMIKDNNVYRGRGTTDDKGPALTAMYAIQYAATKKLPLNFKIVWELEEEIGSPSFKDFLNQHQNKLKTDSILISDTIWDSRQRPTIPYGLRGLQGLAIRLKTGTKDIHSGLAGGLARNPIGELSQLIFACYDAKTGYVNMPGFYDDVHKINKAELDNVVMGFSIEEFKKKYELNSVRTSDANDAAQRIWVQPTFEVHGINGGYNGPGIKTIIPYQAEAKISMRLVPNQDPEKIFALVVKFVKERCPDCEVIREGSLRPYLGKTTGPYAKAARQAITDAFGKHPVFVRGGGSIGAVVSMQDVLKAPIMFLGLSLPEHGYHSINENYDWQQTAGGIRMFVNYFNLISSIQKQPD